MARIIEKIVEPSRIEVGSLFKIKVKVSDMFSSKEYFITESGIKLITEDGKLIRTEWGE